MKERRKSNVFQEFEKKKFYKGIWLKEIFWKIGINSKTITSIEIYVKTKFVAYKISYKFSLIKIFLKSIFSELQPFEIENSNFP